MFSKTNKENWRTTHLDLEELRKKKSIVLPEVNGTDLPKYYIEVAGVLDEKKGTIISWRNCDRLSNTRAETIIDKSEALLGQLYRYLLQQGKKITLEVWELQPRQAKFIHVKSRPVRCNDPLFLMSDTLVSESLFLEANRQGDASDIEVDPAKYFKQFSTSKEKCNPTNELVKDHSYPFKFKWKGNEYQFSIKTSHAHLDIQKPGHIREGAKTEVGKFYGQRKSISFVRAEREISSDNYGFYKETQPQHRWWGIEIQFNADADDLLGVHNNKQGIEFWKTEHENYDEEFNEHTATLQQARERLWIELTRKISSAYSAVWKIVKEQDEKAQTRNAGSATSNGGIGLPGSTKTTATATRNTDGERKKRFTAEERSALHSRLKEKFPDIPDKDISIAVEKFDEWKLQSCILYCPQVGSKTLWTHTAVMGFLIILINTENQFYKNIMMPFRVAQFEPALAAIELFISSLAVEEHERYGSNENAKEVLEQYRAYVGLHLDRYLKDNDVIISDEDLTGISHKEDPT